MSLHILKFLEYPFLLSQSTGIIWRISRIIWSTGAHPASELHLERGLDIGSAVPVQRVPAFHLLSVYSCYPASRPDNLAHFWPLLDAYGGHSCPSRAVSTLLCVALDCTYAHAQLFFLEYILISEDSGRWGGQSLHTSSLLLLHWFTGGTEPSPWYVQEPYTAVGCTDSADVQLKQPPRVLVFGYMQRKKWAAVTTIFNMVKLKPNSVQLNE